MLYLIEHHNLSEDDDEHLAHLCLKYKERIACMRKGIFVQQPPTYSGKEENSLNKLLEELEVLKIRNDKLKDLEDEYALIKRVIRIDKPDIKWDDIIGQKEAKKVIKGDIEYRNTVNASKLKPRTGLLMYGPPGTGKTCLAKAACSEYGECTFFEVRSSDIHGKYVGESEKLVRALFKVAEALAPSIIFIDEVDAFFSRRTDSDSNHALSLKNEFLQSMSGLKGVYIMAATNRPTSLDSAFTRRFDTKVLVDLPTKADRIEILQKYIGFTPNLLLPHEITKIAQKTELFSGADLESLVKAAQMEGIFKKNDAEWFLECPAVSGAWVPCKMKYPDAVGRAEINWSMVIKPPVTYSDFKTCLKKTSATLSQLEYNQLKKFK